MFAGAGLSIPPPSSLPSAWDLAQSLASRHKSVTGNTLPLPLWGDIEALACHFYGAASMSHVLDHLIDWAPFRGTPNDGHLAIADFLSCGAIKSAITTNVDVLIEAAAATLGDTDFYAFLNGHEANTHRAHMPLLKVHGCCERNRTQTLWCPAQLSESYWREVISTSSQWLGGHLLNSDLVFIGFWSDWQYLNRVLSDCLSTTTPTNVYLVDPSDIGALAAKAPELYNWASGPGVTFQHVKMSGTDFLMELRVRFSQNIISRIVDSGRSHHEKRVRMPPKHYFDPASLSMNQLYTLRRDFAGVPSTGVARTMEPSESHVAIGSLVTTIIEAGGSMSGQCFLVNGQTVRVLNGAGYFVHEVQNLFATDAVAALYPAEVYACVGANDDGGVPHHLTRMPAPATIVRSGISGDWTTYEGALNTLGI
jgi:hypothetical protein